MNPLEVLAIIPARGGSKGLPGKNTRLFHGKPLLHWTIAAARESGVVRRVVVSTEDEGIAEVARAGGADVPFMRPAELARDETPVLEAVLHMLERIEKWEEWVPNWVLLLQPTSPLRTAEDIRAAAALAGEAVVSVSPVKQHPHWLYRLDAQGRLQSFMDQTQLVRRQELEPLYALNGALYLVRTEALRRERTFVPASTKAHRMPAERSVDIDTETDWLLAELLWKHQHLEQ